MTRRLWTLIDQSKAQARGELKGPGKVLVVDDEESIREALKLTLEFEGYVAVTAENGKDALDVLANGLKPCLILLDLMMPVMNGWQFLEELDKKNGKNPIPIVIVTAFGEKAKTAKVPIILKKPVEIDTTSQSSRTVLRPLTA